MVEVGSKFRYPLVGTLSWTPGMDQYSIVWVGGQPLNWQ
jgi:hypothetical protein